MKTKRAGRVAVTVPVSLGEELSKFLEKRWRSLHPKVSSRSHYFQLLIDLDRKGNLIDPKIDAQLQLAGFAE